MIPETWTEDAAKSSKGPLPEAPAPTRFRLHHLLYLVFFCAILSWLISLGAFAAVGLGLVVLIAAATGIVSALVRRRSTHQDALLGIMAIAAEHQMPLGPAFEAYADQCGGGFRRKVLAMASLVGRGASLPEALDRCPGILPRDAELLVRIGSMTGTLPSALRQAGAGRGLLRPAWTAFATRVFYLMFVLVYLQAITAFIMYFIIPKFEAIFKDFGAQLPPVTTFAIEASHVVIRFGGIWFLFLQLLLVLYLPFLLFSWWRGSLPFFDRLLVRRHSALILRSLSLMVEGGMPLSRGFEMLCGSYPTRWVQVRLTRVSRDVSLGEDWVASLARRGLIRGVDAAVLESARRAGNLPWALVETAESGERRLAYQLQFVVQAIFPLVVIALGVVVGVLAIAYFSPLVRLIQQLTPYY